MKPCEDLAEVWMFDFALESTSERKLCYQEVEGFFDTIIKIAESRGLQVGGGFKAYKEEDDLKMKSSIEKILAGYD